MAQPPIHPQHLDRIDADLRARIVLEHGYGRRYGVSDSHLSGQVAGMRSREEIIASADVVLLPKPTLADVAGLPRWAGAVGVAARCPGS